MGNEKLITRCTCSNCGWVYMAYTREQAQAEVDAFNKFYDTLTPKQQNEWYKGQKASISKYEKCWCYSGMLKKDPRWLGSDIFSPYKDGDCPEGCTISPIIWDSIPWDGDLVHWRETQ